MKIVQIGKVDWAFNSRFVSGQGIFLNENGHLRWSLNPYLWSTNPLEILTTDNHISSILSEEIENVIADWKKEGWSQKIFTRLLELGEEEEEND